MLYLLLWHKFTCIEVIDKHFFTVFMEKKVMEKKSFVNGN